MNIPSWINPTQSFTVVIDYYSPSLILFVKDNQGRGVVLIEKGLINFLPLKRGGLLEGRGLFESRGLNRGFMVMKKLTKHKLL